MCVTHIWVVICVPVTIYMLVGAHVLGHCTHSVVSYICVWHTYVLSYVCLSLYIWCWQVPLCSAIVPTQSCHIYVCLTHMSCHMCACNYICDIGSRSCVRPSYPLSRVIYTCVSHIRVVIYVPTIIYVILVGASVVRYYTSVMSYIWHDFTPFPPYSTKKILKLYRSQGGFVSNFEW